MFSKAFKVVAGAAALGTVGTGCYIAADEGRRRSFKFCTAAGYIAYSYSGVKDDDKLKSLHKKYAPELLKLCTDLGGYYIKLGQTLCGMGILPEEYENELSNLLDNCPTKPIAVIQSVIENEFGKDIKDIFSEFEEEPVGSGSIGQVHRAILKDGGDKVIVKVQYPEVEKYFRLDFQTMKFLLELDDSYGDKIGEVLEGIACTFDSEFDYRREASNMRRCRENCMPKFGKKIYIPDYYEKYSSAKVLTMEEVQGVPIRSTLKRLLQEYAAREGKTVDDYKADMKSKYNDPAELRKLMSSKGPSESMMDVYIAFTKASNLLSTAVGKISGYETTTSAVPLNGPKILRTLNEVHAHQIFVDGLYNSDPHAGNVLMMNDGRLGLIDYGGVAIMEEDKRTSFAKLLVAISDKNEEKTIKCCKDFGFESKKLDRVFMMAYAYMCFHRGLNMDDLVSVGVPEDVNPLEIELYLNKRDQLVKCEPQVITVQRCANVLLGISGELNGGGSLSIAEMWREPAINYLKSIGENVSV